MMGDLFLRGFSHFLSQPFRYREQMSCCFGWGHCKATITVAVTYKLSQAPTEWVVPLFSRRQLTVEVMVDGVNDTVVLGATLVASVLKDVSIQSTRANTMYVSEEVRDGSTETCREITSPYHASLVRLRRCTKESKMSPPTTRHLLRYLRTFHSDTH